MVKLDPWSYAEKTNSEHAHQVALFMWANMAEKFGVTAANDVASYHVAGHAKRLMEATPLGEQRYLPQLEWLHAIHNQGHGDAIRGAKAKAEGVKAGVYDLFLPCPNYLYHEIAGLHYISFAGLYIEMKKPKKGQVSDKQKTFKRYAENVGYKCVECWNWLDARDQILSYLGVK